MKDGDTSMKAGSSYFAAAGTGHHVTRRCDYCARPTTTAGSKKLRRGWACAACVRSLDAQKAARAAA